MKNYLPIGILICLLSCCQLSFAQPSYTANSNPAIGQSWDVTMYDPATFLPGPAGANQNWDFSALPISTAWPSFQFNIIDPTNAPFTDSFPGATHVLKWDLVGFPFHQYEYGDNQVRAALGGVIPEDTSFLSLTKYLDDDDALQYPLTFQKNYTFTSLQRVDVFGFSFEYYTEGKSTVDAYGTLKLASGTYNNIIRLVIERVQVDSLFFPPERDTSYQYLWFQEGNGMPLLAYEYSLDPDGDEPSLYAASPANANSIADNFSTQFSLSPNPVKQFAYLHFPNISPQAELEITLFDLQGKMLKQLHKGRAFAHVIPLDFQGINRGIFMLKINDQEGNVAFKKIVKQ